MQPQLISALLTLSSFVPLLAQGPEPSPSPLSVCEVVAHRIERNGEFVAVKGEVKSGPHGSWLQASSDCQYKLITKGIEWPNAIYLTYRSDNPNMDIEHQQFSVDWTAIDRSEEKIRRLGFNPKTDRLIMTYIGMFLTYPDLENRVSPNVPGALRLGFGPAGLEAPAELLIKSVAEVRVERMANHEKH